MAQLLKWQSLGTEVIVVEMPVHPSYYSLFAQGQQDYQQFVTAVSAQTQSSAVPFWRMAEQSPIPADGWWDAHHLNDTGATVFSQWLGERVAQAVQHNALADPTRRDP